MSSILIRTICLFLSERLLGDFGVSNIDKMYVVVPDGESLLNWWKMEIYYYYPDLLAKVYDLDEDIEPTVHDEVEEDENIGLSGDEDSYGSDVHKELNIVKSNLKAYVNKEKS
ncbi:hypothetical protein HAX54_048035 [Datura stramonium]|uniref:Uncharacterized protein n=1 Tax=Datura stramonium TaxID=4076 RepID=A0ABS8SU20_DATST|nr:hypothetical protein [Datura stramonium]